jgi:hypothetical protein
MFWNYFHIVHYLNRFLACACVCMCKTKEAEKNTVNFHELFVENRQLYYSLNTTKSTQILCVFILRITRVRVFIYTYVFRDAVLHYFEGKVRGLA